MTQDNTSDKTNHLGAPTETGPTCTSKSCEHTQLIQGLSESSILSESQECDRATSATPPQNHAEDHAQPPMNDYTRSKDSILSKMNTNELSDSSDTAVSRKDTEPTHESSERGESAPSATPLREPVKKRPSHLGSMARKKRKSQLAEMSAAVTSSPVKLNTLEKSKLDWEAFKGNIATEDHRSTMPAAERDELDSQTQGGGSGLGDVKGYLHRKEFLDRVHERLDQQESHSSTSR